MKPIYLVPILSVASAIALGATINRSVTLTNFNAGELSPQMEARVDFPKYRSGARELQNMIVRSQGPVTRRPGTKFVAEVRDSNDFTRLVPFEYSTTDAYVLELGDKYVRFYRNGAPVTSGASPYDVNSPWDANDLFEIQFAQDAQYMRFVHPDYPPYKLTRNSASHTDWTLAPISFADGPFLDENEDHSITVYADATTGDVNLIADANIFDEGHEGALWQVSHLVGSEMMAFRFWGNWSGGVDIDGDGMFEQTAPTEMTVYKHQTYTLTTGGDWYGCIIIERSYNDGNDWDQVKSFASVNNQNVLYTGIEENEDAIYRVSMDNQQVTSHMYRHDEGECDITLSTDPFMRHGTVLIDARLEPNHVTGTVQTKLASTDATWRWAEGAWSDYRGWPRAIEHHEQRCLYAGTDSWPQTVWASIVSSQDGDYDDFDIGLGDAADAWMYVLPGQNPVQWMVSAEYLMIGTSEGVGRMGWPDRAITPEEAPVWRVNARNGCAYLDAVAAIDAILYVEKGGEHIREVTYTYAEDRYVAPDMSILAEHIAKGGITQIDFAERPDPILWCVRGDGVLLSFTYQRKQEVLAWARHITGQDPNDLTSWDEFESIAIIPGTSTRADGVTRTDDELWAVVKRTVDGNEVRYVEQFQALDWGDDPNYCWFVDCAGNGVTTEGGISGTETLTQGVETVEGIWFFNGRGLTEYTGDWATSTSEDMSDDSMVKNQMDVCQTTGAQVYTNNPSDVPGVTIIRYRTAEQVASDLYTSKATVRGCAFNQAGDYVYVSEESEPNIFSSTLNVYKVAVADASIAWTYTETALGGTGSQVGRVRVDSDDNVYVVIQRGTGVVGLANNAQVRKINSSGSLVATYDYGTDNWMVLNDIWIDEDFVLGADTGCLFVCGMANPKADASVEYFANWRPLGDSTDTGTLIYPANAYTNYGWSRGFMGIRSYDNVVYVCGTRMYDGDRYAVLAYNSAGVEQAGYDPGDPEYTGGYPATWANRCTGMSINYAGNLLVAVKDNGDILELALADLSLVETHDVVSLNPNLLTYGDGVASFNTAGGAASTYEWSGMTWAGTDASGPWGRVCVYADGRPIGTSDPNGGQRSTFTVDADGVIDLGAEYDVVIAGLNYYSILETMPLTDAETIGRPINIKNIAVDFIETMGAHVGADMEVAADWTFSDDDFATSMQPFTGYKPQMGYTKFSGGATRKPVVYIYEWDPVPMTIRSITANLEVTIE